MAIVIYNTLTRRKETFVPLHGRKVGMYVCGVTVYDRSHLGHARSAINFDVIVRWLRYRGYEVNHVTNFTDVDDKAIARAQELGIGTLELTERMIAEYFRDMDALKVRRATVYPKASETMPEIIAMVKGLIDRGYAYESRGSVYFSVRKAKEYGKLSHQTLDQMEAGARIEPGEDKRDPMDFALWKAAKPGEISWDSPWGKGRPGWHIECSAMCLKHIGKTVDIHGGGTDLIFPHHENEILQSEAYNDAPFVRYWMHNGMLTIDQEKMSKSLKNYFSIADVLRVYPAEVVRFYLLNASYRAPLEYNENTLGEAAKALERLQNAYDNMRAAMRSACGVDDASGLCANAWSRFEQHMDDDFSTRDAIAVIFDLAREANKMLTDGRLSAKGAANVVGVMSRFNEIFDVLREEGAKMLATGLDADIELVSPASMPQGGLSDEEVELWLRRREVARRRKDFAYADAVRQKLAERGIEIRDSKDGATWKRK
ncbi:MAG: cysteine--tRNA ligase [Thermoplasmata archaeon]